MGSAVFWYYVTLFYLCLSADEDAENADKPVY